MPEIVIKSQVKEPFYRSRRVQGAVLSAISVILIVAFPASYDLIAAATMVVAMAFGLRSWQAPK